MRVNLNNAFSNQHTQFLRQAKGQASLNLNTQNLESKKDQVVQFKEFTLYKNTYDPLDSKYIGAKLATNPYFTKIDEEKTLENVHKLFTQLTQNLEDKDSYTMDEILQNIPYAFEYDNKSLKITQSYSFEEYEKLVLKDPNKIKTIAISFSDGFTFSDFPHKINPTKDIFKKLDLDIGSKFYTDSEGKISKSGIFAVLKHNFFSALTEGKTSIRGKLEGLDRNLSDEVLKELQDFLNANKLGSGINGTHLFIFVDDSDMMAYEKLLNSDLSIEDFKKEYLYFKELVEEKQRKWMQKEGFGNLKIGSNQQNTQTQKTPTPIQAKSSNQTYKDKPTNEFLQKLLKDKFEESDLLELLFEDKTYKQSFKNIFKNKNLNLALQFLQVDIKA
ncbi:hypothetical protein DMB92_00265 [Campylobacter sp. MIT 99-7217]|uniref:hypothetical protein n=1 Tax=Campylobacter sp. MIT 99-7217 TaxID=535091 RepID=UPI00115A72A7|nr:hypothetical protein [Campylobacter sp. MIT 99-7217]TQR34436.1 hypothetical protein DMB92_00265 [Campylobacter sp. MIT 99-7217]